MSSFDSQILWQKHSRELDAAQNLLPGPKRIQSFLKKEAVVKGDRATLDETDHLR